MTREEAIEILEGLAVPIHAEPAFDMAIEALKAQLPSAQPEIIRCKDCKYYDPNDHCYLQGAEADDFCSYAERRTDE